MKIQRGTWDTDGPCWIPIVSGDGRPLKPVVKCRCGRVGGLGLHTVAADGNVTASFFHPLEGWASDGMGCGFHEFLKLEGYEGPAFGPHEGVQ